VAFLAAIKTFPYFLLYRGAERSPRPLFAVFPILLNGGFRYPVYLVGIALLGFALESSMSSALVFGVSASKIVVQPKRQVNKVHSRARELLDGYRILDTRL
jgi:hypothetical protein